MIPSLSQVVCAEFFHGSSTCHGGLVLTVALFLAGCGTNLPQGQPVSGLVTYQGEPLQGGGTIYYEPRDKDEGRPAMGFIREDGTFTMRSTKAIRGVLPGEYKIRIEPPVGGQVAQVESNSPGVYSPDRASGKTAIKPKATIPSKYHSSATSELTDSVGPGHSGKYDIELTD